MATLIRFHDSRKTTARNEIVGLLVLAAWIALAVGVVGDAG
jgi:hypothetical protein